MPRRGVEHGGRLDEVDAIGGDAAAALDELLIDYGWRSLGTDLTPTLAEQPEAIVAMINGALAERRARGSSRSGARSTRCGPTSRG